MLTKQTIYVLYPVITIGQMKDQLIKQNDLPWNWGWTRGCHWLRPFLMLVLSRHYGQSEDDNIPIMKTMTNYVCFYMHSLVNYTDYTENSQYTNVKKPIHKTIHIIILMRIIQTTPHINQRSPQWSKRSTERCAELGLMVEWLILQ